MREELLASIQTIRATIRTHRDQKGDDRCWLDDYPVWSFLEGSPSDPKTLPSFEDGMEACRDFFLHRRTDLPDQVPDNALTDPLTWDTDLESMAEPELQQTKEALLCAIQTHRDIADRPRTVEDDRALYRVLPENIPADFRLPSEEVFLGESKAGVGCPAFWKSHGSCGCQEHDLHRWGPCDKNQT